MRKTLTIIMFLLLFSATKTAEAQGAIVLSTTILEVGPRQRSATVSVANRSAESQRYRISIIDMVMAADGRLSEPAADGLPPGLLSASSWVIATPRSLELAPGQSQTIRMLFRRPADLADGEYRAHLRVAQEPPATIAGGLNEEAEAGGMRINIVTVYSTSIPIVFKQGQVNVSVSMSAAQLVDSDSFTLTVENRGNASFRGFARATVGDKTPVNLPVTIYPECAKVTRTYDLPALAETTGPLTLTLHEGAVPREAEDVPPVLETLTISR